MATHLNLLNAETISVIADLCTISAFIVALVTLIFYLFDKLNKEAAETRANFLAKSSWTNEGDIHHQENIFFDLQVTDPDIYYFFGHITFSTSDEKILWRLKKVKGRKIWIELHQTIGWHEYDLAIAIITKRNPNLWDFWLIKDFEENRSGINIPYRSSIW